MELKKNKGSGCDIYALYCGNKDSRNAELLSLGKSFDNNRIGSIFGFVDMGLSEHLFLLEKNKKEPHKIRGFFDPLRMTL